MIKKLLREVGIISVVLGVTILIICTVAIFANARSRVLQPVISPSDDFQSEYEEAKKEFETEWIYSDIGFDEPVGSVKTFREAENITLELKMNGKWVTLDSTLNEKTDALKIHTIDKPYYLKYQTNNYTFGWVLPVSSRDEKAFSGHSGYPINALSIEVYSSKKRLFDDYVVMYRAKTDGVWLDWVSNGEPQIMECIKREYELDGGLDTKAIYAGMPDGKAIEAFDIRVFERIEDNRTPPVNAKLIDAPYIYQGFDYPQGCEAVTAVMALQHAGIDIDVDTFIDGYLDMGRSPSLGGYGPDPEAVYCGNPKDNSGWGCCSSVIAKAVNKLDGTGLKCERLEHATLDMLCKNYIDCDIPVMIWATVDMRDSSAERNYAYWKTNGGKKVRYNMYSHCLLLVGYDDEYYYFNDPLVMHCDGTKYTAYPKKDVEKAYAILNSQSLAIYR